MANLWAPRHNRLLATASDVDTGSVVDETLTFAAVVNRPIVVYYRITAIGATAFIRFLVNSNANLYYDYTGTTKLGGQSITTDNKFNMALCDIDKLTFGKLELMSDGASVSGFNQVASGKNGNQSFDRFNFGTTIASISSVRLYTDTNATCEIRVYSNDLVVL